MHYLLVITMSMYVCKLDPGAHVFQCIHLDLKENLNALNTCASELSLHTCIDIVITKRQCITKVEYSLYYMTECF
jgi:hypothetical protein